MFCIICSIFWGFILLSLLYQLGIYFDLAICSMFWILSCIFIAYISVISLVWTTRDFYPCITGFSTLNKLCLLCALDFYFVFYIIVSAPHRFLQVLGNLFPLPIAMLLCWHVFPHQTGIRADGSTW